MKRFLATVILAAFGLMFSPATFAQSDGAARLERLAGPIDPQLIKQALENYQHIKDLAALNPLGGGLTGTKTVGGTLPDYLTITAAITDLTAQGVGSGGVTFRIRPGIYGTDLGVEVDSTLTIGEIAGASASNPIRFVGVPTVIIERSGTTSTFDVILSLLGADYVEWDSVTFRQRPGGTAVESGIFVTNSSVTNGATHNTFKNFTLTLNTATNANLGGGIPVFMVESFLPTATSGSSSFNRFYNFTISGGGHGFQIVGGSGSFPHVGTEVGTMSGGTSTLSYGHNTVFNAGIGFGTQSGISIFNVDIISGTQAAAVSLYGIAAPFGAQDISTANIYNNRVSGLVQSATTGSTRLIQTANGGTYNIYNNRCFNSQSANTGASYIAGIANEGPGVANVYNNFISDLRNPTGTSTAGAGANIHGFRASGTGAISNVYYNTIYLDAANTSASRNSGCITTLVGPAMTDFRNNILVNKSASGSGTTGRQCAVYRTTVSTVNWDPRSNNNLVYAGTGLFAGKRALYYDATNTDSTLTQYKSRLAPRETEAVSEDPPFVNVAATPYDLHLNTAVGTRVESGGQNISGITTDIDGDLRAVAMINTNVAPDLGADEFSGTPVDNVSPSITYTPLSNTSSTGNRMLSSTIKDLVSGIDVTAGIRPRLIFRKNGGLGGSWASAQQDSSAGVGTSYTFTIDATLLGGLVTGDTVYYYAGAADSSANVATNPAGGSGLTPPGGTAPAAPNFYRVLNAISGVKTIGASGADYTNVTNGFNAINGAVVTGAVTLLLNADYSSAGETFPITLNQVNYEGGVPSLISLSPNATVVTSISGVSATSIIKLNGADNVTIDGSNSGGFDRSLSVTNTGVGASSAVIWIGSLGTGLGANHNTIKNTNLMAGVDQSALTTTTFGVFVGNAATISTGTAGAGADNDTNTISFNDIQKVRYGVFLNGSGIVNLDQMNAVRGNVIGPAIAGANVIGKVGIGALFQNNLEISGNDIRFVQGSGGTDRMGIAIGSESISETDGGVGSRVTNASIFNNKIHDLNEVGTFTGVGISLKSDNVVVTNNRVFNNMIWNVLANGTAGDFNAGVSVHNGRGDLVAFNSIYLVGDRDPGAAASASVAGYGIRVSAIGGLGTGVYSPTIRDNISFIDMTSNTVTLKNYCIGVPAGFVFGSGGSNYNDFLVPGTGTNPQSLVGLFGAVIDTTLAQWQASSGQDANSISGNPQFTSGTNLLINTSATPPSAVANAGVSVAGITLDIQGDGRSGTPDIGADEFTLSAPAAFSLVSPTSGSIAQPLSGTLVWTATSGASAIDVYYDLFTPPTTLRATVGSGATSAPYGVAIPGTYFWNVVARNIEASTSSSNGPFSFTTVVPPNSPSNLIGVPGAVSLSAIQLQVITSPEVERLQKLLASGTLTSKKEVQEVEARLGKLTLTLGGPTTSIQLSFTDNAPSGPNSEDSFYVYARLGSAPDIGPPFSYRIAVLDSSPGSGLTVNYLHDFLSYNEHWYYKATAKNAQGESAPASADTTTFVSTPGAPTFSDVLWNRMKIHLDTGANPGGTEQYAIRDSASGLYVAADGTISSVTEVWQTYAQWGGLAGKQLVGLARGTLYTFNVKARNGANVQTAFGPSGSEQTTYDQPLTSLSEDFTTATFPPPGWTLRDEPTIRWLRFTTPVQPNGIVGPAVQYNFYDALSGEIDTLVTPKLNLSSAVAATLNWYHAYRTFQTENDSVFILISSDGGTTWTTLLADGNPNMATLPPNTARYVPGAASDWRLNSLDIPSIYLSNSVQIAWRAKSAFGNQYWIDNVVLTSKVPPDSIIVCSLADPDSDFTTTVDRIQKPWYLAVYRDSISPGTLLAAGSTGNISLGNLLDGTYIACEADSAGWGHIGRTSNGTPIPGTARYDTIVVSGGSASWVTYFVNSGGPSPTISGVARSTRVPLDGDSVIVSATVAHPIAVNTVWLLHDVNGVSASPVAMTRISGNAQSGVYEGEIPGSDNMDGNRIEYRIQAYSTYGASSRTAVAAANSYFAGTSPLSLSGVKAIGGNRQILHRNYYARLTGTINGPNFQTTNLGYFFQDAVGGINLFAGGILIPPFSLGDSVVVIGRIDQFRGLTEIIPDDQTLDISTVASGRPLAVMALTLVQFNADPESYESRLIRLDSLSRRYVTPPWPGAGTSANIVMQTSPADTITMRIDSDTEIDGSTEPTYPIRVTGVGGQFTTVATVYNDGYQIMPRYLSDISTVVGVNDRQAGVPAVFALDQNYPNPFNPTTRISYALPKPSSVTLTVYNVLGQEVATLVSGEQGIGFHMVEWDGRNRLGNNVGSGLYFYRIEARPNEEGTPFVEVKKMLLLK